MYVNVGRRVTINVSQISEDFYNSKLNSIESVLQCQKKKKKKKGERSYSTCRVMVRKSVVNSPETEEDLSH